MCTMPTGLRSSTTSSAVIGGGVQDLQRRGDQRVRRDGLRIARHHLLDAAVEDVAGQMAAEVAVGDDADQIAVVVDDAEAAEALLADQEQRFLHRRAERRERQPVAGMHHVADMREVGAERAAGMEVAETRRR